MLKLLKLVVLLGLAAGLVFVVPFGGRTLFGRWLAAKDTHDFVQRTWAEMRGASPAEKPAAPRRARPSPPVASATPKAAPKPAPDQPLESTTEADRKALDKLLDRHLGDAPGR